MDQDKAAAQAEFDGMLRELEELIKAYRNGKREQPFSDLSLKLFAVEQYSRDNGMLLFNGSNIQDRILVAIDRHSAGYLAVWHICDEIGMSRNTMQGHKYPNNEYEKALAELVAEGVLEEVPDLSLRYQRKTQAGA